MKRRLRSKSGTKAEFLIEDQAAFLTLPPSPFDACRKHPTRANSLSLVRFDDNDYSVPVAYAHHEILAKGYIGRVVLCHKEKVVAEHQRSWGKQGVFFDYIHYLPLLARLIHKIYYLSQRRKGAKKIINYFWFFSNLVGNNM